MVKVELKTRKNNNDAYKFLDSIENEQRKKDAKIVVQMMKEASGEEPVMWGDNIIGFGNYSYKYATGREGDWMRIGLSPRKGNLSIYIMNGFSEYKDLLNRLGKHKTGSACLYVKKLEDVDMGVLREIIKLSYESKAMGEQTI